MFHEQYGGCFNSCTQSLTCWQEEAFIGPKMNDSSIPLDDKSNMGMDSIPTDPMWKQALESDKDAHSTQKQQHGTKASTASGSTAKEGLLDKPNLSNKSREQYLPQGPPPHSVLPPPPPPPSPSPPLFVGSLLFSFLLANLQPAGHWEFINCQRIAYEEP